MRDSQDKNELDAAVDRPTFRAQPVFKGNFTEDPETDERSWAELVRRVVSC